MSNATATVTKAPKATKAPKVEKDEAALLAEREKNLRKKYHRINPGTLRYETDGHHKGKYTVEIRCATRGCPNVRRVATSDLFQVSLCEECTAIARANKRKAARKEAAAARKEAAAAAEAKKGARKAVKVKKQEPKPAEDAPAVQVDVPVEVGVN